MATLRSPSHFFDSPVFFLPEKIYLWSNWLQWGHGGQIQGEVETIKETWQGLIAFGNSFFYGIAGAAGSIVVASMAAYALAKIRFRGADIVFLLIISAMFFPPQIFILPFITLLKFMGIYNTRFGLLIIYIGLLTPFATFILRNYFLTIHQEIVESARLDGASETRIWSRIIMPLARPALAVAFIFLFTFILSDYLFAASMTVDEHSRPVVPFVVDMFMAAVIGTASPRPIATVGAILIIIPTLLIFFVFQRYFIRGLLLGSVKK